MEAQRPQKCFAKDTTKHHSAIVCTCWYPVSLCFTRHPRPGSQAHLSPDGQPWRPTTSCWLRTTGVYCQDKDNHKSYDIFSQNTELSDVHVSNPLWNEDMRFLAMVWFLYLRDTVTLGIWDMLFYLFKTFLKNVSTMHFSLSCNSHMQSLVGKSTQLHPRSMGPPWPTQLSIRSMAIPHLVKAGIHTMSSCYDQAILPAWGRLGWLVGFVDLLISVVATVGRLLSTSWHGGSGSPQCRWSNPGELNRFPKNKCHLQKSASFCWMSCWYRYWYHSLSFRFISVWCLLRPCTPGQLLRDVKPYRMLQLI